MIEIDGIVYEVVKTTTAEGHETEGRHNIARMMRETGQARQMYMRRPKGNVMYFAVEYLPKPGYKTFGKVVSLGRW